MAVNGWVMVPAWRKLVEIDESREPTGTIGHPTWWQWQLIKGCLWLYHSPSPGLKQLVERLFSSIRINYTTMRPPPNPRWYHVHGSGDHEP